MSYTNFILLFMLLVAAWDFRYRRIPNAITVFGLAAGLLWHAAAGTLSSSLMGAGVGFVAGFFLFYAAAIGAGDVKLLTALGAILGLKLWITAVMATLIAAGVIGLIQAIRAGKLLTTIRNMGVLVVHISKFGLLPHPELNVRNKAAIRSPFGVAAGIGVAFTVLR